MYAMQHYIETANAMLQQCRAKVLASFTYPVLDIRSAGAFAGVRWLSEYDPWLAYAEDPWRSVMQSIEAMLFQQTSRMHLQAKVETHRHFEFYNLRLGHVLHFKDFNPKPVDAYGLCHA